jgi:hypothetical protein
VSVQTNEVPTPVMVCWCGHESYDDNDVAWHLPHLRLVPDAPTAP